MLRLFALPLPIVYVLIGVSALLVCAQAACGIMAACVQQAPARVPHACVEFLLLPQCFMYAMMLSLVPFSLEYGLILWLPYRAARLVCALSAFCACCFGFCRHRDWLLLGVGGLILLTAPFAEPLVTGSFPYAMILGMLGLGLHTALRLAAYHRARENTLTRLSVKDALDTLKGGILLADEDGFIRLMNHRMTSLIASLRQGECRDANGLWQSLCVRGSGTEPPIIPFEDGSIWQFTRAALPFRRRRLYYLTAADITELSLRRCALEERNVQVARQNSELAEMIRHIDEIQRAEEIRRAKRQVHDVMGQRMTILQRALQGEACLDQVHAKGLLDNLAKALRGRDERMPEAVWQDIVDMLSPIGVSLYAHGAYPRDRQVALVLLSIVREAATNAVRHGRARTVHVFFDANHEGFCMRVENDGRLPETLREGNGLAGIRASAEEMGGTLEILLKNRLTLVVKVPERSPE